jgi:hypothetical protein
MIPSKNEERMKRVALLVLAVVVILGCSLHETRRGIGNEGFLNIQATPDDADVYVDGERVGQAGKFENTPLELSSGTHKIEIRKAGFLPEVRDVYAGNQSRHTLKVNLRKSP